MSATCQHCYCLEVKAGAGVTKDHVKCCNCGNKQLKKFGVK